MKENGLKPMLCEGMTDKHEKPENENATQHAKRTPEHRKRGNDGRAAREPREGYGDNQNKPRNTKGD
jgi:hypothetical protein